MKRELGIFERAQVIADRHSSFHFVGVLRLEDPPVTQTLQRALALLQKRHPFLSAKLTNENGRLYFATLNDPALPFQTRPRLSDGHWIDVVESELANRIDAAKGPMFRCTYLYDETQQQAEIILAISHSIADAASVSQLLHELMMLCASPSDGTADSVSQLSPAPPLESRFPNSYTGWRLILRIIRYALAQMADEFSYRVKTIGKGTLPFHKHTSRGRILPVQFPSDLVESFAQHARKEGVTLNSALNAALLLAVNRHLYSRKKLPMRTFSFADLRPYVEPPLPAENLGLYISMMRYTVDVDGDFWSLARDLHKKIYKSLKSGDKFVAAIMVEGLMKMVTRFKSFRMGTAALNYTGVVPVQPVYGKTKVVGIHGFVSAFDLGPEFASQAQVFNDQLFWDFAYLEEDMDEGMAKTIVNEVKGILHSVIASRAKQSPI